MEIVRVRRAIPISHAKTMHPSKAINLVASRRVTPAPATVQVAQTLMTPLMGIKTGQPAIPPGRPAKAPFPAGSDAGWTGVASTEKEKLFKIAP